MLSLLPGGALRSQPAFRKRGVMLASARAGRTALGVAMMIAFGAVLSAAQPSVDEIRARLDEIASSEIRDLGVPLDDWGRIALENMIDRAAVRVAVYPSRLAEAEDNVRTFIRASALTARQLAEFGRGSGEAGEGGTLRPELTPYAFAYTKVRICPLWPVC